MFKTLSVAALIAATSTAAFAGSLAPYEEPKVEEEKGVFVPVKGTGIGLPLLIGAAATAAVVGLVSNDDDEATATTTTTASE